MLLWPMGAQRPGMPPLGPPLGVAAAIGAPAVWHVSPCWLPGLTFQYPVPEGGWPLMLIGVPL